ncbi:RsmB/NOP family class I SAM-dependent RNA methyltransferase [Sphingomonas aracearum]|uniref:RsmB/NOP family class I SAM-dependent RNA methyltransferase n=1 Tax=Sphingomonas aracearum TaxID=2283317 RepID=A0A369VVP2_9SPHN|nr:RsmB/NOP family class I SAM-dependent RNA methyltransferase [Sphingomonas aracearum]RDE05132.1 RsmB/NOP family class I SAM-dependent RNA methyltransferase [Sphingomonas aracearum]
MTPAARTQAAIELLDAVLAAAREGGAAADTLVARYFATRRYAGSKDRRAIRELVYRAIRAFGEPPESGRAALAGLADEDPALAQTFDGSARGPAAIAADEPRAVPGVAPAWLLEQLAVSGFSRFELPALVDRAPLDIRINVLRPGPLDLPEAEPIAGLPNGRRLPSGTDVERLDAWREGCIEVQDGGSQFVSLAAQAEPGQRIIDLCAGAGGKTLALAAAMENRGELLATDTDRARLSRLPARAERAGASIATTRLLDPGRELAALDDWRGGSDTVLIDAPCSGTGTWRRNPEARWRLTPERLARLVDTQERLLEIGRQLVRPGGALVFIVCSLLDAEGADRIDGFLARHRDWEAEALGLAAGRPRGEGVRLTPAHDGTDGFFVARLRAPC